MTDIITKYRPQTWEGVVGHHSIVKSLQQAVAEKRARAFLFTGPSGVGKTTIARILARELGVDVDGLAWIEVDAATQNGVDAMRDLKNRIRLHPLGSSGAQAVCMDECHMLTAQSWNSLLKDVEEPPPGVIWIFCTTLPNKVPKAIHTRCLEYALKPVADKALGALLDSVIADSDKDVPSDAVLNLVIDSAGGSPRQALVGLAKVWDCETTKEAQELLESVDEDNADVADFCRALMKGASWSALCGILGRMENASAEGIRNVVCAWFTKVAMSSPQPERALAILQAFGAPYPPANGLHPVLLSIGELLFRE